MDKIATLEIALQYFAGICDEFNLPVGVTVTLSGKFAVKYSLHETLMCFDSINEAFDHIIRVYKNTEKNG